MNWPDCPLHPVNRYLIKACRSVTEIPRSGTAGARNAKKPKRFHQTVSCGLTLRATSGFFALPSADTLVKVTKTLEDISYA